MRTVLCVGASLCTCAASAPLLAQSFTNGDIYLVSASLDKPVNMSQPGVLRIDPVTWSTTLIYTGPNAFTGRATYDAFRDRLIMRNFVSSTGLFMLAADGSTSELSYSGAQNAVLPAAAGDGRVYFIRESPRTLSYVDAAGSTHDLMQSGVPAVANPNFNGMFHHAPTNSLLIAYYSGSTPVHIERISLSADGGEVTARTTIDFSVGNTGEIIVGFSDGPNGSVFVKLDDNSGLTVARMLLLDVPTMTLSGFASSGYFGVGGEVAGAFSSTIGAAVVLDSLSNFLRVFGQGSVGEGSIVLTSSVSSAGGSGEQAQLVPIVKRCIADFNNDGFPDAIDYDVFITAWLANDPSADVNHDEFVDAIDYDLFITHWVQGC